MVSPTHFYCHLTSSLPELDTMMAALNAFFCDKKTRAEVPAIGGIRRGLIGERTGNGYHEILVNFLSPKKIAAGFAKILWESNLRRKERQKKDLIFQMLLNKKVKDSASAPKSIFEIFYIYIFLYIYIFYIFIFLLTTDFILVWKYYCRRIFLSKAIELILRTTLFPYTLLPLEGKSYRAFSLIPWLPREAF